MRGATHAAPLSPRPFQPCPDEYLLKKITIAATVAVLALGAATWASPYYALHQMKTAVAGRDAAALAGQVDFPALRSNVKDQLAATMSHSISAVAGADNPFAAMGAALGNAMLGKMVDAMVSPAGVEALVSKSALNSHPQTDGDDSMQASAPAGQDKAGPKYAASYAGWDRFVIRPAQRHDDAGALVLRRHGLWSWKLSEIELSKAMAAAR